MAAAYRHGADSRLPGDAGAPGVHAVSLRAVVLALHLRSGGALWRGERRLARYQTHPALPPAAPGRLRPGAVRLDAKTHRRTDAQTRRGDVERRVILAVLLMLIVAVLPSILFPPKKPADRGTSGRPDSTAGTAAAAPEPAAMPAQPSAGLPVRPPAGTPAETVWVTSPLYRLGLTTRGGALVRAELLNYRSFAKADSGRPVQLVRDGVPLLAYRRTGGGGDTTLMSDWSLTPSATRVQVGSEGATLTFTGARDGARFALEYRFFPAEYRFAVRGRMEGFGPAGATLLLGMGDGLRSVEADSMDDFRHYAVVTKATKTQRTDFGSVKPGERKILDGPFEWTGIKSKYFFTAALAVEENEPRFGATIVEGGPRTVSASSLFGRSAGATRGAGAVTLPVPPAGAFDYQVYVGPLEYRRLSQLGHDLDDANPYGGCLPMLLPMPVLFALFFVFANTIEFRGVAFLWLPDLSRPDPYYIIPILMGLSMFVLSKVGQIGMPPNPQTKMMLYFMPAFLTLLFLNFASGLNLYYAVSNIFSIPQQYLIARRRLREQGKRT